MPSATASATARPRDPLLDAYTQGPFARQHGGSGRPDFDSILRAAPAYDDIDDYDNEEEDEDAGASTSYLPEKVADLTTTARPFLSQHASLHAFLDANWDLDALLTTARNQIHIDTGKLASRTSEANRLERVYSETSTGKKLLWTPTKRKAWRSLLSKSHAEHISSRDYVAELTQALEADRRKVDELERQMLEFKRVEGRLDTIDDMVFGAVAVTTVEEKATHRQFHLLHETLRRLRSAVQLEVRAQKHLDKALSICNTLTKELLAGLQVGIEIGVPTNTKHKTQLWQGTSGLHTARQSRGTVLRAKTLSGDLQTHYIQSRAIQRRVRPLPKLEVIALNKLPDMKGKGVLDELGLHRAMESAYAQAKSVKSHINTELQRSKQRQKLITAHVLEYKGNARATWLQLRILRRKIMDDLRKSAGTDGHSGQPSDAEMSRSQSNGTVTGSSALAIPPPYGHHIPSSSTLGAEEGTSFTPADYASSPPDSELTTVDSRASAPASSSTSGRPGMLTETSFRKGARGLFAEARANDERVQARQRRRYLALPKAVRSDIDQDSISRARSLVRNAYVQVGGIVEDEDVGADAPAEEDDDLPGLDLIIG